MESSKTLLAECKSRLQEGGVMHHPFLKRMEAGQLRKERMPDFVAQWYKVSQSHRTAFRGMVGNPKIADENILCDLTRILMEEYGEGDRKKMHVRLLNRMLTVSGLTVDDVAHVKPLPSIAAFSRTVSEVWREGEPATAFGLHFGLEYLASAQQVYFSRGMKKYDFLSPYSRKYFNLHAEAETRHVAVSERGFLSYANNPADRIKLLQGIEQASVLLNNMWGEFDSFLFPASQPSLRTAPLQRAEYKAPRR